MKKVEKISLNNEWNLNHEAKPINIAAQVPGTVFETLIENKIIEDPFYGEHEHEMTWVFDSDWHYKTEFDVKPEFLEHSKIVLRFYGLDTISEIYLNGEMLGFSNNMFRVYDFDVKSKLKKNANMLEIIFKSPTKKASEEIKKHEIKLNTPTGIPGIPYLRKAQYSFGWDWGPKLPDIGIWRPVELIGFDEVKIESIYPVQTFKYNKDPLKIKNPNDIAKIFVESVNLRVIIELNSILKDLTKLGYNVKIDLTAPDGSIFTKKEPLKNSAQFIEFDIINPQLWWTHDLGSPNLYELTVSILNKKEIDILSQKIGIRDIRLIREPDKWGETFYFLLNGVPIFAKGANWIPIDSFIPRGKKLGLYTMNLNYAKEANMNMIRVWGGGIYEDDLFYELCDELGILVWQDFPFACAVYPPNNEFVENVKEEAIQNIKRLRHHPSLALWCGNNEIEQLWVWLLNLAKIESPSKKSMYKNAYLDMFEKMLPELVKEYDPQHSYWPSSPSNGSFSEEKGFINSNSPNKGDSHFWDVWHGGLRFSAYRKFYSRFMSEYGFESFPSMKTIETFCPPDQYDFHSPIMENHQKNPDGNKLIMRYMKKRFSIPKNFKQQVILSQITQGEAIEYGVEHWRRNRNDFHCMGSLYWQLNDCWQVASWASLDYFGRWKALHYFAKRFYRPFFPSVKEDKNQVEFWVSNDLKNSRKGTLKWKILNPDGKILMEGLKSLTVPPCSSLMVETADVSIINKNKNDLQSNIIFYSLKDDKNNGSLIYHGFRLFDKPKNFPLKEPGLTHTIEEIDTENENETAYQLTVNAKNIALYLFIESNMVDFVASDNYFSLEPGKSRTITLKITKPLASDKKISGQNILDTFNVGSLYDLISEQFV